jgi:methyltransferase (TIGR00027 family)
MQGFIPSRTALRVAMRRAAHQMFDRPRVLDDPIAIPIVGRDTAGRLVAEGPGLDRLSRSLRAFVVARSRYTEDQLERAVEEGIKQYVILGAGLDTFPYRNPHAGRGLRVFEMDHPATQQWKRELLAAAEIPIPSSVIFVPSDFERQTLSEALRLATFDANEPTFFSWLGVTMYLEREAVMRTLRFLASCAQGSGVVFDYSLPPAALTCKGRLALKALSRRVEKAGEPFRTFFVTAELVEELTRMGFHSVEDMASPEINARYFKDRADGLRVAGGLAHLMSARG